MAHKFTVFWRPLEVEEFRVDFVEVDERSYEQIMVAAAQKFIDEVEWAEDDPDKPTARGIIYGEDNSPSGYDFISIIDGHIGEARYGR
jgi:hypothetical protein